jgi:hypothetical protein
MVRYTRLPHTPPRYKSLWCGTPGYLTPHLGTSRYRAVQQDILHSTQIPAFMWRYTMLPHTPPRYQQFSLTREMARYGRLPHTYPRHHQLWYGAVHQVNPPRYQKFSLTREMAGYTRLQNPIDFPEASCTQCTVNTKIHNASVINPIAPGGLIRLCSSKVYCAINCFKENLPHFPAGGRKKKMMRS